MLVTELTLNAVVVQPFMFFCSEDLFIVRGPPSSQVATLRKVGEVTNPHFRFMILTCAQVRRKKSRNHEEKLKFRLLRDEGGCFLVCFSSRQRPICHLMQMHHLHQNIIPGHQRNHFTAQARHFSQLVYHVMKGSFSYLSCIALAWGRFFR